MAYAVRDIMRTCYESDQRGVGPIRALPKEFTDKKRAGLGKFVWRMASGRIPDPPTDI